MGRKRILVWSSGDKEGGGSGFEHLVLNSRSGELDAKIVGVVSNHEFGGVRKRADRLGIQFYNYSGPWDADVYRIFDSTAGKPDLHALSGWLKLVKGLDPKSTINIHPGPLPDFGGHGMYGHHVHEAVVKAYREGKITCTAVSMHFVTPEYDQGPIIFQYKVGMDKSDTPDDVSARVNRYEHGWQSYITNLVVQGMISWDGHNPKSLKVPPGYEFLPK